MWNRLLMIARVGTSALVVCAILFAAACFDSTPAADTGADQRDAAEQADTARDDAPEGSPDADDAPAVLPPDEIVQGTGGPSGLDDSGATPDDSSAGDSPTEAADAASGDEGEPAGTALADLPGFVPSERLSEPSLGDEVPELAAGLPVLFRVTILELTPTAPRDLRPLEMFLLQGSSTLDPTERASLDELISMLTGRGFVQPVSSPTMLISEGSLGAVEIVSTGQGSARKRVALQLAPTFKTNAVDESEAGTAGDDGVARPIEVGFAFRASEASDPLRVIAQDLGLPIGPRARVDGSVLVNDLSSFVVVRRVVGDGDDREYMLLISPRVMPADFSK